MVSTLTVPERAAIATRVIAPYLHGSHYRLSQPKYQIGDCVSIIKPGVLDPNDWDSFLVTGIKHSGISSLCSRGWMNQPSWFYAIKPPYSARKEVWVHEDDLCLVGEEDLATYQDTHQ